MRTLKEYDRNDDGVTMIAISSLGRTKLGRGLAVGAHLPTTHRQFGNFNSMAGLIRYLNGDKRVLIHLISGLQYDDALNDKIDPHNEEILQEFFLRCLTTGRGALLGLQELLHTNHLPLYAFDELDGELIPVEMPVWFTEVLTRLAKRKPEKQLKGFMWDDKEFTQPSPTTPEEARIRSLKELQAEWLRLTEGSDAFIDFWVSQPEFDSIPAGLKKVMGDVLKIQYTIEGQHTPKPAKKIM